MKKVVLYFVLIVSIIANQSCKKETKQEGTATKEFSGDWWVILLGDDGDGNYVDVYEEGYLLLSTYNTASNVPDKLFVDFQYWPFKGVVDLDQKANNFGGEDLANLEDEEITAIIKNGKIIRGAATTSGGNVSDSIYLEIEFSDDSGFPYIIAGYRRTGFVEDEH